jgi:hypothetical protein
MLLIVLRERHLEDSSLHYFMKLLVTSQSAQSRAILLQPIRVSLSNHQN